MDSALEEASQEGNVVSGELGALLDVVETVVEAVKDDNRARREVRSNPDVYSGGHARCTMRQ